MATTTKKSKTVAFVAELAELMERHHVFIFVDHKGNLEACNSDSAEADIPIAQANEYGNITVTPHRLRTIAAGTATN